MSQFELMGVPCAHRGPYTFYKAFKYTKNDVTKIITINEFFFVKLWNDSDLISIGELRLLWEDKNCDTTLACLRLYILPENTLEGRHSDIHGEDEVLAITERVVIKMEDLLTWITEASNWNWGLNSVWNQQCILSEDENTMKLESDNDELSSSGQLKHYAGHDDHLNCLVDCSAIDYADLRKEKKQLDMTNWETRTGVVVLSYARYCRYRGLVKRLEGVHNEWLKNRLISALGGFTTSYRVTKILFCKDTFDYPDLEGHELLCNHLAPKLKSEIMKKKKAYLSAASEDSDSSEYESSSSGSSAQRLGSAAGSSAHAEHKKDDQRIPSVNVIDYEEERREQKAFVQNLYSFMKARLTPIGRLPLLGCQEINLHDLYEKVITLGGYASVTKRKLWQRVYEAIGKEKGNPVADTIVQKHYEKFLLPYELHVAQQLKHSSSPSTVRQQAAVKYSHSVSTRLDARLPQPAAKPGDKENIPFSQKRTSISRPEQTRTTVINLCDSPTEQRHTMSTTAEVIDLCEDSPIKRSIPSIAATLQPKKRKLDALREGGLEVTPVAFDTSSFRGEVTITRKTVSNPTVKYDTQPIEPWRYVARHEVPDMTIRPWPSTAMTTTTTPTTTSRSQKSEVLDLRTSKNNDNNIIKKLGPSLGPSIEISLIPTGSRPNERKRRPPPPLLQPPVPPLKKIWTGAPTKKENRSSHNQQRNVRQAFDAPPMQNQFTDLSQIESLFFAELCGTWLRNSTTGEYRDIGSDEQIARQLGLNEQQWHYLKSSFSKPKNGKDEEDRNNLTLEAMAQRYANVFKNNTVSLIENYEKILPD